jgi:O-antigen/teichoic acid export membrane protein
MAKSLKQKAASGMIWTAIQKYSNMGIGFISGIILARLLTPFDYGCIGMLAIFMTLAESFVDGGFGSALIQKKKPTQEDYSTIFFWNMFMAFIMYAILFASAPAIASFYNIPVLCDVLRVQGLVLFIHAFAAVQSNQLRKMLNFRVISIATVATSLISLSFTIFLAYHGAGVWALVASNLLGSAIPAICYWWYLKWHPILTFSWQSFRELFSFGFYMFLTHLVNNFGSQIQGLFIGKFYNPSTMGYYSKALSTEQLASNTISSVMTQVTYPLYAEMQDDRVALGNIIKRISMTISYITFPILCILLLAAKPIFLLLYSERWLPCVPYFQMLCLAGMGTCLTAVNTQSIAAIGKSKIMLKWTIIKRTVGILCVIGGLFYFGMTGLLIGAIINSWFSYFVNILLVSKYINYKWTTQLFDLLPIIIVTCVVGCTCFFCVEFFHLNVYQDGLIKLILFVILYLGWSFLFKPESFVYTKGLVTPYFKRIKKIF